MTFHRLNPSEEELNPKYPEMDPDCVNSAYKSILTPAEVSENS